MNRIVLASASPRRRDLFSRLNLPFDVRPVNVDESGAQWGNPEIIARRLARVKAEAARLKDPDPLTIAADTVVALDGPILGKPADADNARDMLRRLKGRAHAVVTAVAVVPSGARSALARHPLTVVSMRDYSDQEIDATISRGDPFDKAGAYAIQDDLFRPVERYDGCYCNVVGLPLWSTIELVRKAGVDVSHISASDLLLQCATCPMRPDHS